MFNWDLWNQRHIAKHNVTPAEAEFVVTHARNPFPRRTSDGKYLVWGQTDAGRHLQVIFVYREVDELEFATLTLEQLIELSEDEDPEIIYVVHAMTLPPRLLKQYRRLLR